LSTVLTFDASVSVKEESFGAVFTVGGSVVCADLAGFVTFLANSFFTISEVSERTCLHALVV